MARGRRLARRFAPPCPGARPPQSHVPRGHRGDRRQPSPAGTASAHGPAAALPGAVWARPPAAGAPLWRRVGRSGARWSPQTGCAAGRWEVAPTTPEGDARCTAPGHPTAPGVWRRLTANIFLELSLTVLFLPDASRRSVQLRPPHALFEAEFNNLICMHIVSGI